MGHLHPRVLGFVATLLLKDRSAYDHTQEYEEQEGHAAGQVRQAAMV